VNTIKGLGEEIKGSVIVQKILRSLPMRFDPKISALEEREDLATLSMDELHGILTTYEMRTEQDNPSRREATFKASKKTRKNKQKSKSSFSCSDDSDEDEEIANFVRRLKKGTGKYKGKLPLKCFNCGKIGHFASKCPYARSLDSDEEEVPKKEKKYQKGDKKRNKRKFFKKSLYSREDSSSSDEDNDSDSDSERVLFMAMETQEETLENDKENYEEEGEVDLEAELISALSDLRRERKKNKSLKEELIKLKEGSQNPNKNFEEVQQIIINLKVQLEEAK
jgi:hypothetical protein